jgi:hypothetical protein
MAAKRRGRKRRTAPIDIRAVTGLTYEELHVLQCDLNDARETCPPPLFGRLERLVRQLVRQKHQYLWDQAFIQYLRWDYVCKGRAIGGPLGWCEFQFAADVLRGTPAEADWKQMKRDYEIVEKEVDPEKRQARIKRPRQQPTNVPHTREDYVRFERYFGELSVPGWPVEMDYARRILPGWPDMTRVYD